jgi:hypothetical protein
MEATCRSEEEAFAFVLKNVISISGNRQKISFNWKSLFQRLKGKSYMKEL